MHYVFWQLMITKTLNLQTSEYIWREVFPGLVVVSRHSLQRRLCSCAHPTRPSETHLPWVHDPLHRLVGLAYQPLFCAAESHCDSPPHQPLLEWEREERGRGTQDSLLPVPYSNSTSSPLPRKLHGQPRASDLQQAEQIIFC